MSFSLVEREAKGQTTILGVQVSFPTHRHRHTHPPTHPPTHARLILGETSPIHETYRKRVSELRQSRKGLGLQGPEGEDASGQFPPDGPHEEQAGQAAWMELRARRFGGERGSAGPKIGPRLSSVSWSFPFRVPEKGHPHVGFLGDSVGPICEAWYAGHGPLSGDLDATIPGPKLTALLVISLETTRNMIPKKDRPRSIYPFVGRVHEGSCRFQFALGYWLDEAPPKNLPFSLRTMFSSWFSKDHCHG